MKRQKRLTKREKKATEGGGHQHEHQHIHCIVCGRHLDPEEFSASPATARIIACQHSSKFPVCTDCVEPGKRLLAEHDRTGQPVKTADAWH